MLYHILMQNYLNWINLPYNCHKILIILSTLPLFDTHSHISSLAFVCKCSYIHIIRTISSGISANIIIYQQQRQQQTLHWFKIPPKWGTPSSAISHQGTGERTSDTMNISMWIIRKRLFLSFLLSFLEKRMKLDDCGYNVVVVVFIIAISFVVVVLPWLFMRFCCWLDWA